MADHADIIDCEIWKPVLHWEGLYEVSDLGNVRSLDRIIYRKNGVPMRHRGKALRPTLNEGRGGRLSVHLRDGNRAERREVHVLVCQSFHGPKPSEGMVAAHWDGDASNNKETNIRWATQAENMADAMRHGTLWRGGSGRRPAHAKEVVNSVIADIRGGYSVSDVAMRRSVSLSTAYRLKRLVRY